MAKVYVDTKDLSREELIELLLNKDDKIDKIEGFRDDVLFIFQEHKVLDTNRVDLEKGKEYIKHMEDRIFRYVRDKL